jgi:hypothetical protein
MKSRHSFGGPLQSSDAVKEDLLNRRMLKAQVNMPQAFSRAMNKKHDGYHGAMAITPPGDTPTTQEISA